ncbi:hypothetical protein Gotri_002755 [Gossypium trilobum]|uniref:Uncharacterized protein n=1 Tax=Gossypium trilobum TaxID=34281 RepID=A0A7J9FA90_9ROSI|nr:hypothetical protein [Gossypium trilobum]
MEKWRGWLRFERSLAFPTKCILLKAIMTGKRQGLLGLYKDLEGCGEYEDIQVMWKMVHSSCPSTAHKTRRTKRPYSWRINFCFRPS